MNCAKRTGVYAFIIGISICAQNVASGKDSGKEGSLKDNNGSAPAPTNSPVNANPSPGFQWQEHSKLSWDDFQGPVNAVSNESAAATHCGIGFKTNVPAPGVKPEVTVYNKFYVNKSWVKSDAKIPEILDHEQGHFDLCEIFTRKLRQEMGLFNFNGQEDFKLALISIYTKISDEYESTQQAYEKETAHGTNIAGQKKWRQNINRELTELL
jgi:hypothetical protein